MTCPRRHHAARVAAAGVRPVDDGLLAHLHTVVARPIVALRLCDRAERI
jgi:hypothetical protein